MLLEVAVDALDQPVTDDVERDRSGDGQHDEQRTQDAGHQPPTGRWQPPSALRHRCRHFQRSSTRRL